MVNPDELYGDVTREIVSKGINVLNAEDPVGEAIIVENKVLGKGGEGIVYKGKLDLGRLTKEGFRELLIPILTHQKLNGKSTMNEWDAKNKEAKQEVDSIKTKEGLEKEIRDAFKEQGIIRGNHADVAVRISTLSTVVNLRDERCKYLIGMRGDNIAYQMAHGVVARNLPYNIIELMDGMLVSGETSKKSPSYNLHVFKSILKGLRRFQQLGIVHRDIKPSNIFYRGNHGKPEIKLADFGTVKAEGVAFNYNTKTGMCMGTPVFMCPEQPQNAKGVTWQGDQFSAAATMYTLLSDNNPIGIPEEQLENMDVYLIFCHVVQQDKKRKSFVSQKDKQLEGIERILARMMQKNPSGRYSDYESILEDIKLVENKKLPQNAGPELVPTVFEPGKYSNHYHNFYRNLRATGIGAAVATALITTAYFTGGLDKIGEILKQYLPIISK